MNRLRLILLGIALVTVVGVLTQGATALSHGNQQLLVLREHTSQLEKQLAAQLLERAATARELSLAERQLAGLPPSDRAPENALTLERETEIKAWLARVKRLKQLFEKQPAHRIPEMSLLQDDEWLHVAKRSNLETDDHTRKALADVRDAAKHRFVRDTLISALQKYWKEAKGERPASLDALMTSFESPPDLAILRRYEITHASQPGVNWAIREISAVGPDYDSRLIIDPPGSYMSAGGLTAWIPNFKERLQAASKAYAAAHPGLTPTGTAPLLPYFTPPLDPSLLEKLLKAERDRPR